MARYVGDLKKPTCLFEAAAWHYAVQVSCACGHTATFDPHGLFWRFYKKGWPYDFRSTRSKMWCRICRARTGRKVRPRRLDLLNKHPREMIVLEMPDESEWKRLINRFRG
ncbi:hypothetical protein [Sphingobium cupriresistens]|uniref:hypothetical protein n=1 Tax=Sphingobium cupriresistens TaxID=1132417 RepID=UPI003BADF7BE